MLTIPGPILDAILAHARRDHPIEACGLVAGRPYSRTLTRHIPLANDARSHNFWQFNPDEYLTAWQAMEDADEEPLVIYHSHTRGELVPSPLDIRYAVLPEVHYLIVSSREPAYRAWRVIDGAAVEDEVSRRPGSSAATPCCT